MLHLVAGLSTGHKIGLGVVAVVFIAFALSASFLAPRRWPDFPGRNGLSPFILACLVVFVGMLAAVYFFGKESEAEAKGAAEGSPAHLTIRVTESEWKVQLPKLTELNQGSYTFKVHNAGKVPHDLVITGPRASGQDRTKLIPPGKDATLKVALGVGSYTLYCSVPGHRGLGMQTTISVG
ncbi:MAG TPA: plastocyanin/azurin family copper-binding protein [Gaiellaceae bacterium]